jgi:hypothetical protein
VNKFIGPDVPYAHQRMLTSESSNAAESNTLSKAARDRSPYRFQAGPFEEFCIKTCGFIRTKFP